MFLGVVVIYLKTNITVFPYLLQLIDCCCPSSRPSTSLFLVKTLEDSWNYLIKSSYVMLEILKIPCVPVCINRVCINLIYISSTQAEHGIIFQHKILADLLSYSSNACILVS